MARKLLKDNLSRRQRGERIAQDVAMLERAIAIRRPFRRGDAENLRHHQKRPQERVWLKSSGRKDEIRRGLIANGLCSLGRNPFRIVDVQSFLKKSLTLT